MIKKVHDFSTYKDFLRSEAGGKDRRKGTKSAMARALGCQPTFISQVLHSTAELSLEQALTLSSFLELTSIEIEFFILLVQRDRAGTPALKRLFDQKIKSHQAERMVLTKRLGSNTVLSDDQKSKYYSSWIHAAIHIALTVPHLRTLEALS